MNKQSIEKLRRRIIVITTLLSAAVMLFMAGLIYAGNVMSTARIRRIQINRIIENGGVLPDDLNRLLEETESAESETDGEPEADGRYSANIIELLFPGTTHIEAQDSSSQDDVHYFTVYFDENGDCVNTFIHDAYIGSEENAAAYGKAVSSRILKYGSYERYYYRVASYENGSMVVFLDSTELFNTNNRLMYIAMILFAFGTLVTLLLVHIFSYKMVRPEIENAERQKQFITNASHELKTPLAVIRANTEVEQMINGENEWNTSTMRQINRLTALIENLVKISRAEEQDADREPFSESDLSKAVRETIETFRPVAEQDGKELFGEVAENITLLGHEGDMRQLTSLLLDNAIKYCDESGTVRVVLNKRSKTVHLTVSNSYADGAGVDYSRFFDRFYRQDESHTGNQEKGGFGIGLSIAESLVSKYHGKILVSWKDGIISFHCTLRGAV